MTRSFKCILLASSVIAAASFVVLPASAHDSDGQNPAIQTSQTPQAPQRPDRPRKPEPKKHQANHSGPLLPGPYVESSIEDSTTRYGRACIRVGDCHVYVDTFKGQPIGKPEPQPKRPKPKGNGQGGVDPVKKGNYLLWPLDNGTYQLTDLNQNPVAGIQAGDSAFGYPLAPSR